MIKWYRWIRISAYIAGIGGLLLFLWGKNESGVRADQLHTFGAGGVALSFALLFVSYVLYTLIRMARKR